MDTTTHYKVCGNLLVLSQMFALVPVLQMFIGMRWMTLASAGFVLVSVLCVIAAATALQKCSDPGGLLSGASEGKALGLIACMIFASLALKFCATVY